MINPPAPQAWGSGPRTRLMMRWSRRLLPARGLRDRRAGRWVRHRLWCRSATEFDRMRTALLRAVSHDLRSPLAAATAAVSGLRGPDMELAAADRDELLDTAGESLELLSRLAASLLDLTRLQAGARPVFPRPSGLGEIITHALAGLGLRARAVRVDLPPGLPAVMADPPLMERVIANLTSNALRYSPAGTLPLLTARARGGQVELRVTDRGPGVLPADRDTMFAPFRRLGDPGPATGVGLGLAVARGLTEAMRGRLEPEETPGGGLTMTISVPAASLTTHRHSWQATSSPDRRKPPDDNRRSQAT
jgi:two-component system, OmpR family, sensor histidine kinase KdpD